MVNTALAHFTGPPAQPSSGEEAGSQAANRNAATPGDAKKLGRAAGQGFRSEWDDVRDAFQRDLSVLDACNEWYAGAYLMETLASVLYILMRHGDDFEEALVRAVNDTRDNDTVAAIVGAAAIPARWRRHLLGRLGADDDGHLFELLDQTRRLWLA